MKNYLILIFSTIFFSGLLSCEKDEGTPPGPPTGIGKDYSKGVFVVNEGNYGFDNSSLTYYDPLTGEVQNHLYEKVNGLPPGDVLQSMTHTEEEISLVVNNSGKILVVDRKTMKLKRTLEGLPSPRYLLHVDENKSYVSNFILQGETVISIIDRGTGKVTGEIPVPGWTEKMALAGGKVFVLSPKTAHVLVIDPLMDKITDSIRVKPEPLGLVNGKEGALWVLCNGGFGGDEAYLYLISGYQGKVIKKILFPAGAGTPSALEASGDGEILYYLTREGVHKYPVTDEKLPETPWIKNEGKNFYGLGVDNLTGDIYVCDAIDNVQEGVIYVYGQNGFLISEFAAGILPGSVYFLK